MLRNLFAIMLQTCAISNHQQLWDNHKENLAEDILHHAQVQNPNLELDYSDAIFNQALIIIEDKIKALCAGYRYSSLFFEQASWKWDEASWSSPGSGATVTQTPHRPPDTLIIIFF